jgi:PRC-barrel domain
LPYAAVDSKLSQTFARPEEFAGFWLCDPREKRIGMVEKLFVNWSGEPEYIRVSVGFFGFKSVLLPVQDVAVDEQRRILVLQ